MFDANCDYKLHDEDYERKASEADAHDRRVDYVIEDCMEAFDNQQLLCLEALDVSLFDFFKDDLRAIKLSDNEYTVINEALFSLRQSRPEAWDILRERFKDWVALSADHLIEKQDRL